MNPKTYDPGLLHSGARPNSYFEDFSNLRYQHNVGPEWNYSQESVESQCNLMTYADKFDNDARGRQKPNHAGNDRNIFQEQRELHCNLSRYPNASFSSEEILENLAPKTGLELGKQMHDHVTKSRYQEVMDMSLKEEFMKQEVFFHQLGDLIHHEMGDSHLSSEESQPYPSFSAISRSRPVIQTSSPGLDELNSSSPRFDHAMLASAGYVALSTNSFSESTFVSGPTCDKMAYQGNNFCSHIGVKQIHTEVVPSPEPMSSVTACSDVDWPSDKEPIDCGTMISVNGGQFVPEVSSQIYSGDWNLNKQGAYIGNQSLYGACHPLPVKGNMKTPPSSLWVSGQVVESKSSDCKVLPSVMVHKPTSNNEEVFHSQHQVPGSQHINHYPYVNLFGELSVVPSQMCSVGSRESNSIFGLLSSKLCELPLASAYGVQQNSVGSEMGPARDDLSKLTELCNLFPDDIILQYMNYKNMPINVGGTQVPFLNWLHLVKCAGNRCDCSQYQLLISHFDNCNNSYCRVCNSLVRGCSNHIAWSAPLISNGSVSTVDGDILPPAKRKRLENTFFPDNGLSTACKGPLTIRRRTEKMNERLLSSSADSQRACLAQNIATHNEQQVDHATTPYLDEEANRGCRMPEVEWASTSEIKSDATHGNANISYEKLNLGPNSDMKVVVASDNTQPEANGCESKYSVNVLPITGLKGLKKLGVSLIDILTAEQLEEHIQGLGKKITLCDKVAMENMMAHSIGDSTCQLCAMDKLVLNPVPIYCSKCGFRLKRNLIYYWSLDEMGGKHCFCRHCVRNSRGGEISFQGFSFCREKLQKGRNNEENEESWVQCDKCERWQHQICGLYNAESDLEGNAKYVCPYCRLQEIKVGEHMPSHDPCGAKDFPCTKLSDHIEERLFRRLKEERQERALSLGKNLDEVPGVEDLVVRVVLSVNKQLKVKQEFLDIFQGAKYPVKFPYKLKVILLFQKIKGVDVCLFGMYVQEFGSDCHPPNNRSIYISYLDSVKYFQPDIQTAHGEALRTFVYHEILIGYLDYSKKLGFETCYFWACPPLKGEDYILNCHPESQKTPKSDKLRQWYKSMLQKAAKEDVVAGFTNLYDRFFVPNAQCSTKVTAANLPYFDGAYWSGAAEEMIRKIGLESSGSEQRVKKLMTKRTLKAMGHTDLSAEAATDVLVMQKLGHAIYPVKEDFIVVHLQFVCSSCHDVLLSQSHWLCGECRGFLVCSRCINVEPSFKDKTHFISGEKHLLSERAENDVPQITDDRDRILDNDILENRHSFLSFCQEHYYQFDTLRRAKYSSMMILYHLHKHLSLALVASCSICHNGTEVNDGWQCELCPEFHMCTACYQREGTHAHIHELTRRTSMTECGTENEQLKKQKALLEKEISEVIVHVFQCRRTKEDPCPYSKCSLLRKLFHHLRQCKLRAAGGCRHCIKAWSLLHYHSRNCQDIGCRVPHCQYIKKRTELRAMHADNRRRAAVEELATNKMERDC